jgi:putative tricarboxylic transport membrane protein
MSSPQGDASGETRPRRGPIHWTDLIIALVAIGFCAFIYNETGKFEEVSLLLGDNMPPQAFPRLVVWVIVVLAALLPFEHLFNRDGIERLDRGRAGRVGLMVFATGTFLVLVVLSIQWVGMLGAMVLVALGLPLLWAERRFGLLILFAIIFPALVTLLFAYVLEVHFEPGALGIRIR